MGLSRLAIWALAGALTFLPSSGLSQQPIQNPKKSTLEEVIRQNEYVVIVRKEAVGSVINYRIDFNVTDSAEPNLSHIKEFGVFIDTNGKIDQNGIEMYYQTVKEGRLKTIEESNLYHANYRFFLDNIEYFAPSFGKTIEPAITFWEKVKSFFEWVDEKREVKVIPKYTRNRTGIYFPITPILEQRGMSGVFENQVRRVRILVPIKYGGTESIFLRFTVGQQMDPSLRYEYGLEITRDGQIIETSQARGTLTGGKTIPSLGVIQVEGMPSHEPSKKLEISDFLTYQSVDGISFDYFDVESAIKLNGLNGLDDQTIIQRLEGILPGFLVEPDFKKDYGYSIKDIRKIALTETYVVVEVNPGAYRPSEKKKFTPDQVNGNFLVYDHGNIAGFEYDRNVRKYGAGWADKVHASDVLRYLDGCYKIFLINKRFDREEHGRNIEYFEACAAGLKRVGGKDIAVIIRRFESDISASKEKPDFYHHLQRECPIDTGFCDGYKDKAKPIFGDPVITQYGNVLVGEIPILRKELLSEKLNSVLGFIGD